MLKTKENIDQLLKVYEDTYTKGIWNTELWLFAGMCKIYINKYDEAREMFDVATKLNIKLIPEEKRYYFPWHVVETWVFSGNFSVANHIWKILDHYRTNNYAPLAPLAKYSYIVTELLAPRGEVIDGWITDLISFEKKNLKDIYSEGYCFKAIRENNLSLFQENLSILLAKHHNIVRFGSLRETAEGFYCLEGMVLCYCAMTYGMDIQIDNQYISMDYLRFIRNYINKN
jgi:hypothetical protein